MFTKIIFLSLFLSRSIYMQVIHEYEKYKTVLTIFLLFVYCYFPNHVSHTYMFVTGKLSFRNFLFLVHMYVMQKHCILNVLYLNIKSTIFYA